MGLGEGSSSKPINEVVSKLALPKWKRKSVSVVWDFLIIPEANNPHLNDEKKRAIDDLLSSTV